MASDPADGPRTSTSTTPLYVLAPMPRPSSVLANPVQPHSEGELVLSSADPTVSSRHPHELLRRPPRHEGDGRSHPPGFRHRGQLADAAFHRLRGSSRRSWPPSTGTPKGTSPSDALLEDMARHYSCTVYHLTSTCRIGNVVDAELRVVGVANLRVADASVMPNVVSGNTNAAAIMIGEKAAEMVAIDHGVALREFMGVATDKMTQER